MAKFEKVLRENVGNKGLKIKRMFTDPKHNLLDEIKYELRVSKITDEKGKSVFEKKDVEVPVTWSQVATDVLAQKYFRKKGVPKRILDLLKNDKYDMYDFRSFEEKYKDNDNRGELIGEDSIKQVANRLAGTWTYWGTKYGYFDTLDDSKAFYDELKYSLIAQIAVPNSPQWFNTGLNYAYGITGPSQGHHYIDPDTKKLTVSKDAYSHPQPHACFIQAISDDMVNKGGIFDTLTKEARIFKFGSGTGTNFSALREKGAPLSGGGSSSGVMTFLSVFDKSAASIKSGGTTRRAAKMVILNADHPDIEEFINWKVREERKVASLVTGSHICFTHLKSIMISAEKSGLDPLKNPELKKLIIKAKSDFVPLNYIKRVLMLLENGIKSDKFDFQTYDTDFRSEAYTTVDGQNSNNTVRVTNEFMESVIDDRDWNLISRINGKAVKSIKAKSLWNEISEAAWESADPGLQFDTTINEWNTCLNDGRINGSNPCSEYMFLDETACNLASINLDKFYDPLNRYFDIEKYKHTIRLWTIVLEISVLMAQLPSDIMAERTYQYRTLGLGYANLGTMLMKAGVPYDSKTAVSITGSLTAIMTGEAYSASSEMAKVLGTFERYLENMDVMLKVIRNHRRAAYNVSESLKVRNEKLYKELGDYEGLSIKPLGIDDQYAPEYLVTEAKNSWDKALDFGEQYGYRNAQVTVIAPTGTIGLVMDCDTTGIEPDFALVKFKKLVGGGYFKIANSSLVPALENLGYSHEQIDEIVKYAIGHGSIDNAPGINRGSLLKKGLSEESILKINESVKSAFSITFSFNKFTIGEVLYDELIKKSGKDDSGNILKSLGFSEEEITKADEYACGTMTTEGAPYLKEEHYAVFDCANKCGTVGKRFIEAMGHVRILAAAQPFISGSISKTINLPEDATIEEVQNVYMKSWKLMLKCNALYRDGSKLSQPLSTSSKSEDVYAKLFTFDSEEEITSEVVSNTNQVKMITVQSKVQRRELPIERVSITHKFIVAGHKGFITVGLYEDGKPGEIFLSMSKEGSTLRGIMDAWAISMSLCLQYGVPLRDLIKNYAHVRFEPAGMTNNKNIPIAKSVVDYLARWLALKFLPKEEAKEFHNEELVEYAFSSASFLSGKTLADKFNQISFNLDTTLSSSYKPVEAKTETGTMEMHNTSIVSDMVVDLEKKFDIKDQVTASRRQNNEDAPNCSECGSVMNRSGACYKCPDCGATSGCS
ncbi:MAG: adenosylcobalamin-dependent ribonucleoside-diphosphate reductase [bacterium]